jgi:branched-chain amino acid transport system substrate-binding protein
MADRLLRAAAALAAMLLLVLAGCNGDDEAAEEPPQGDSVTVYSSFPLEAGDRERGAAIVDGIELALEERGGRAGELEVRYRSLNNATADDGGPAPGVEAGNARTAVQDESAVAYIGSLTFEATAIALPILNEVGLLQVAPATTYDGLTKATPVAQRGEPEKYYPTEERTFVRLVPIDSLQARVLAGVMAEAGCRSAFVAAGADTASGALARALVAAGSGRGVELAGQFVVDPEEPEPEDAGRLAGESAADCAVLAAPASAATAAVLERVAAALPDARLFGSDGICRPGFASPDTGVAREVGDRMTCVAVVRDLDTYSGAGQVGVDDPWALYGYEAMRLVLDAVERAGRDRERVRELVMATRGRRSALGTYALDPDGDTTLDAYGVYRMRAGTLRLRQVAHAGG